MCGLIGTIDYSATKFFHQDAEAFFSMLLLNSLRGRHSTGAFAVRNDGRSEWIKAVGSPYVLDQYKDWDTFMHRIPTKYTAVIGHGRFATRGGVVVENAHPFKRGKIILVHNGTISNFDKLKAKHKKEGNFEVDSDLCANMFNFLPAEEVLEQLEGAFAFILYDEKENKIKVIKNYDRPLFLFKRKDRQQYLLSSDNSIFDWLKAKYSYTGSSETIQSGELYTFSFDKEEYQKDKVKLHTNFYANNNYHYAGTEVSDVDYMDMGYSAIVNRPYQTPKSYKNDTDKLLKSIINKDSPQGELKSSFRESGISIHVGDVIKWSIDDYRETLGEDQKTVLDTMLIGTLKNTTLPIEVYGRTFADINTLLDDATEWTGKVKEIIVFPPDHEVTCRVFVEDIKQTTVLEEKKKIKEIITEQTTPQKAVLLTSSTNTSIPQYDTFVKLYDKSDIRKTEFERLASYGCGSCRAPILAQQACFTHIVDKKLHCPDCTINGPKVFH